MENEEFDLVGEQNYNEPEEDEVEEKVEEEVVEEETEDEVEETEEEETHDDEDEEEEKPTQPVDNRTKALTQERARRKAAEKELKELKAKMEAAKEDEQQEDAVAKEREAYKKKMLDGDLVAEDVADKLLDVFADDLIKAKIANQKREEAESFEDAISELKKDDLFMDADAYKPKIMELMKKGLTAKEAYMASLSTSRFAQMKKDLEIETEQRILNSQSKAEKVDVGVAESKSEVKKGNYTKREQEIAKETGLSVAEVHKRYMRPGETYSIEDIEKL